MGYTWIKLWIEILDNPKMGQMDDSLWRFAIELFLYAGKIGNGGYLGDVEDIAWSIRKEVVETESLLKKLQKINTVENIDGWKVTNFETRQSALSNKERQAVYRKNKESNKESNKRVTESNNVSNRINREEEKEKEEEENREVEEKETRTPATTTEAPTINDIGYELEECNCHYYYEQNIGPITSAIKDIMVGLEDDYTSEWVLEAMREAVISNGRNIKYVMAILKRWKQQGYKSKKNGNAQTRTKQTEDELMEWIEEKENIKNG